MAIDGAAVRSDDPALNEAFSEMASDGFDFNAPVDQGDSPASQPADAGALSSAPPVDVGAAAAPAPVADPAIVAPDPATDPLAGTEPYTYGADKTPLEGVYRVPGEGLLIPEDRVAQFDAFVNTLHQTSQQQRDQIAGMDRLTSWTRPGPDGTPQTLTGAAAVAAMHEDYAADRAGFTALANLVTKNPAQLLSLYDLDANNQPVLNPERWQAFVDQTKKDEQLAVYQARTQLVEQYTKQPPAGPVDYAKQFGMATITQLAGKDAGALDAEDKAALMASFNQFVVDGGKAVHPALQQMVQRLTANAVARKAQVAAALKAGTHNAGMDAGRTKPKPPVRAPEPKPPAKNEKAPKADWDSPFKEAMDEMGVAIR